MIMSLTISIGLAAVLRPGMVSGQGPPYGHPHPGFDYPKRDGFTLYVVEEFDAPLDLDKDEIWTWSDGGLGEGKVRFVKEAIHFEDGLMKIVASEDPPAVPLQKCSHAEGGFVGDFNMTSGEMRSKHNMFRYGYYEVRMKAPSVQPGDVMINGNYIATMFAYRDGKFRHWRELDIEVTGDAINSVTMNLLRGENTSTWSPQIAAPMAKLVDGVNVRADFHTFAFEWLPTGVTWFIDGEEIRHYAHDGPEEPLAIPDMSTKVMMNLWISKFPAFGGKDGRNNRYPFHSEYDWWRFYKWDGDDQYPCEGMSTSCLTADDWYVSGNNPCDGIEQKGDKWDTPCKASCPYGNSEIVV